MRNEFEVRGNVAKLKLRGGVVLVDREDLDRVLQFRWAFDGKRRYVRRTTPPRVRLHQFVLNRRHVDHKNMRKYDCRKVNLRPATASQHIQNQGRRKDNTSGFRGVVWNKRRRKWVSAITHEGVTRNLGYFDAKIEAAVAYDSAARILFGSFAVLNRPEG